MYGIRERKRATRQAAEQGSKLIARWKRRARWAIARRVLAVAFLALVITTFLGLSVYGLNVRIPSVMYFHAGKEQSIDLRIPATGEMKTVSAGQKSNIPEGAVIVDLSGPVNVSLLPQERYNMEVRLFGILPVKKVDIRVIEDQKVVPMGIPVGIYLKSKGVLVIGTAEFLTEEGKMASPAHALLRSGDVILECNGRQMEEKEELQREIEQCGGRTVLLTIQRDGVRKEVEISPVKNEAGSFKAGIWIRDNTQGVGTLTYVDASGNYGALGHGITDADTGTIMEVSGGSLYQTEIIQLRPGKKGSPGEMTGRITYDEKFLMGNVTENCEKGVYGKCNSNGLTFAAQAEPVPIALKQEIELGPATILCTLEEEVESFEVEITKVRLEGGHVNRGIELRVTDPELLRRTGGIVQGMSGSPILQNGKLIGAVTHVLVKTPDKGYGIFIENMLEENAKSVGGG